jgi:multiple antibiotic resistance protein
MTLADVFDAKLFMSATITLVVIMDPPGTVPVFLSLVGRKPMATRARAARQAVLVSLLVISLFAVAGQAILAYLGIGIPALQGAGGLLLLLIALQLLTGSGHEPEAAADDVNVALVPLGTPLLAGPGAIVATMLFVQRANGLSDYLIIGLGIIAVMATVWIVLRFSGGIVKLLRPSGIEVLTRIAGLLLAAIAVQLIADAVAAFVKLYTA